MEGGLLPEVTVNIMDTSVSFEDPGETLRLGQFTAALAPMSDVFVFPSVRISSTLPERAMVGAQLTI